MTQFLKVNHDDYYDGIRSAIKEYAAFDFKVPLEDGRFVNLRIEVDSKPNVHMKTVYELRFGPVDNKGRVNHRLELNFANYSIVISMILRFAMEYLRLYPDRMIGIDSNNDTREQSCYNIIIREIGQVSRSFKVYGVKMFVRLNCPIPMDYKSPFDFNEIFPKTIELSKEMNIPISNLYNYLIFELKNNINS